MSVRENDTSGHLPQLVIEIAPEVADAIERVYGDGAFEEWATRLRRLIPSAWSDDEEVPAVFVVFDEKLEERLMTDEEREMMASLEMDPEGIVRGEHGAVRVVAHETGVPDVEVGITAVVSGVPGSVTEHA